MNADQLTRFDHFFVSHYPSITAEVTATDPTRGAQRTLAGFASAYRFWDKVEADGDPVAWIHRVIAEDGKSTVVDERALEPIGASADRPPVDLYAEYRQVVEVARLQRTIARVAIGSSVLLLVVAEFFITAHR